jgi:hypothetical protein
MKTAARNAVGSLMAAVKRGDVLYPDFDSTKWQKKAKTRTNQEILALK